MKQTELLKKRLSKDRPMTSITLRVPEDVVQSLKEMALRKGFSGYQALLKFYVGEGLRRDEAEMHRALSPRMKEALQKKGVSLEIIREAEAEAS